MKQALLLLIISLPIACSSSQETQNTSSISTDSTAKADSALSAEVAAMPDTPARKIKAFNDVTTLREKLGAAGIGEMRKWWSDGAGWMSASNFYEIGSPGVGGMPGNLAFYLESPSEDYVETLKVKVNINNMAERQMALQKYTTTVERTFRLIDLTMPKGLKSALMAGKPYSNDNEQRSIKNILEPGNFDSWKLQVTSH